MNTTTLLVPFSRSGLRIVCCAAGLLGLNQSHAATAVSLGAASGFGMITNTAITVAGPSTIFGDAGTLSGTAIEGVGLLTLTGINHGGDVVTQSAHADFAAAFTSAAGQAANFTYPPVSDLGGMTLFPGVHKGLSSLAITGNLTLDAQGDPAAVWIFQMDSTLVTGSGSSMSLIGGAQASNIFWQVGSSATLGTASHLDGSILAQTSITLTTGASVTGGLYARDAAITLDTNMAGIPEPAGLGLLAVAGSLSLIRRRRPCGNC